jgi:single-strand DNA-binding protein
LALPVVFIGGRFRRIQATEKPHEEPRHPDRPHRSAPETRHAGETAITSFTLVTDRPKLVDGKTVKNEAGYTETLAEFHRVTAFNGLGTSVAKHKKKGDLVEVQGRLHYSKWTDREGVERYAVEIVAEEVLFL